ncbi:hypothetical protein WBQ88_16210 [Sphingopyxis sp. CCNWLW253]|uniref:hypothetical protein n=1 Tax=unclassified Sphingopyxis TaxID=2614943 RepID=UPI003012E591
MQRKFIVPILFGALVTFSSAATPAVYASAPAISTPVQLDGPKFCLPGCDFDENSQRCYCHP